MLKQRSSRRAMRTKLLSSIGWREAGARDSFGPFLEVLREQSGTRTLCGAWKIVAGTEERSSAQVAGDFAVALLMTNGVEYVGPKVFLERVRSS